MIYGLFDQKPAPENEPELELPPQPERNRFNYQRHRLMAMDAAPGTKYCFNCDKFEYQVRMYLDGKRWVFYCPDAAKLWKAKPYTGKQSKPTEE